MSKRIRELRLHLENKIADHERKRDALVRQRDDLVNAPPVAPTPVLRPEPAMREPEPVHAGGWLGVFGRLGSNQVSSAA